MRLPIPLLPALATAMVVCLAGPLRAAADPFAGTWSDGAMTLVLDRSGLGYEGRLGWEGRTWPLTCEMEDGVFYGDVVGDGVRYSYLLEPDGPDRVRFTVNSTVHTLSRVRMAGAVSAVTPAAIESENAAVPAAANRPSAAGLHGRVLLEARPVGDTGGWAGGRAGSMLVPEGWTCESGIRWVLHPTMPARVVFRATSPDGRHEIELHPHMTFVQGPMVVAMTELYGNTVARPVGSALELLRTVVLPRVRAGVRWREEGHEPMPGIARVIAQMNEHPMARSTAEGIRLQIAYRDADGAERVERHFAVYAVQAVGPVTYWQGLYLVTARSDRAGIDEAARLVPVMMGSLRFEARWFNRMQQISDAFQELAMANIELARRQSQIIRELNDVVTESRRAAYESATRAMDRAMAGFSEHIRGTDTWQNHHGEPVTLPSGYDHAWQSDNGSVLVSTNPNLNPNTDPATSGANWHPMRR